MAALDPSDASTAAADRPSAFVEQSGVEWIVDAFGCSAEASGSIATLEVLIARLVRDLELHPIAPPIWRTFDGGGVTGLLLLSESHFACHSFPETGFVALNLYCCRQRASWSWEAQLAELVGATRVVVRELVRG